MDGSASQFTLSGAGCPQPEIEDGCRLECTATYSIGGEDFGRGPVEAELHDCDEGASDSNVSCLSRTRPTGTILSTSKGFEPKGSGGGKKGS